MDRRSLWAGARHAAPLVPPLVAFGVLFGVLAVEAGFAPWLAVMTSVVVVSGAAQFALIGLLASGPAAVIVATTGLALRHIPMSAALARLLRPGLTRGRRIALAYVLVDETFGLTVTAARQLDVDVADYKTGADMVLVLSWVAATALGAGLGPMVNLGRLGLEEIFPLMFLGLAAPLVRGRRQWVTVVVAAGAALVAVTVLPPAWRVTTAAVVAAWVGSRARG